jgi:hypothetical protein
VKSRRPLANPASSPSFWVKTPQARTDPGLRKSVNTIEDSKAQDFASWAFFMGRMFQTNPFPCTPTQLKPGDFISRSPEVRTSQALVLRHIPKVGSNFLSTGCQSGASALIDVLTCTALTCGAQVSIPCLGCDEPLVVHCSKNV